VVERRPGPFVDGRPYADPGLIERLEDYHRKAAVAHVEHSQGALSMPEIPQPVLAAPGPGGWLVAPDPDPLNRQGQGNGSGPAGGPGVSAPPNGSGPPDGPGPGGS
jgi:cell division protease FtsH